MEDWDWDADTGNVNSSDGITDTYDVSPSYKFDKINHSPEAPVGKIFGGRGRGFIPADKIPHSKNDGRGMKKNYEKQFNDNRRYNRDSQNNDWESERNSRYDRRKNDDFRNGNNRNSKNDDNEKKKPKSTYVPDEPTENEEEIYGSGISSGINFNKYDDSEVKVSGENPPKAIHSFENAGLRNYMVDIIKKCNYCKPTPIQKFSIPIILSGRDLMACAQTGSGKTAAFLIPIINTLLEEKRDLDLGGPCKPQVVIVSPTRELSIQIFNEARKFSLGTFLKVVISYGGTSVFHQCQNIMRGCHILVATPGRLLDFLSKGKVELSEIRFVVLDEADRLLDMGFLPDMEKLLTHETMVPSGEMQTLMFSATFPEQVQRLAKNFLNDYLFVTVGIVGEACSDVEQKFFSLSKFEKRNKLIDLIKEHGKGKCLVFVEQKKTADFIATLLSEKNFPATSIHGDREQKEREEALRDFKSGRMDILVATSVAARGLDIKNVSHVVNFDLPKTIDEYVHRIGRTGRLGNRGLATSFFDADQDVPLAYDLVKILTQAGQSVPDFLKDVASEGRARDNFNSFSKFGGSDFRNQEAIEREYLISAQANTFEEEAW